MRSMIISIALLFIVNTAQARTLIVSDVDDTIKVTDVLSKPKMIINGLFSIKAFSGMSQLYQEFNKKDTLFYYVSGGPTIIGGLVKNFLMKNHFPQGQNLILKKGKISTYDHKLAAIRELIHKYNPDKIILIGDDSEMDPEVYDTLSKERVIESIYIRAIQNRILPTNDLIKNFFSSAEIAGHELMKANLNVESLIKVSDSFIQDNSSKIFIKKRYCPTEGRAEIEELKHSISNQAAIDSLDLDQKKIIEICNK